MQLHVGARNLFSLLFPHIHSPSQIAELSLLNHKLSCCLPMEQDRNSPADTAMSEAHRLTITTFMERRH